MGMVGRAFGVGVFLCDYLYMNNAGVMWVSTTGIGSGIMSQISLVIHSVIR